MPLAVITGFLRVRLCILVSSIFSVVDMLEGLKVEGFLLICCVEGVLLLFYPVGQSFCVENRAFFAYAFVPLIAIDHTAQAGTNATSHHIFERYLAFNAFLHSIACHCFHHRCGSAGINMVVIGREQAVLCNKSFFAKRAVLGCEADCSIGFKLFLHRYKCCSSSAKQDGRSSAFGSKTFA